MSCPGRGAGFDTASNIAVVRSNVALFHRFLVAYGSQLLPTNASFDWAAVVRGHLEAAAGPVGGGDQRAESRGRVGELARRTGLSLLWSVMVVHPRDDALERHGAVADAVFACLEEASRDVYKAAASVLAFGVEGGSRAFADRVRGEAARLSEARHKGSTNSLYGPFAALVARCCERNDAWLTRSLANKALRCLKDIIRESRGSARQASELLFAIARVPAAEMPDRDVLGALEFSLPKLLGESTRLRSELDGMAGVGPAVQLMTLQLLLRRADALADVDDGGAARVRQIVVHGCPAALETSLLATCPDAGVRALGYEVLMKLHDKCYPAEPGGARAAPRGDGETAARTREALLRGLADPDASGMLDRPDDAVAPRSLPAPPTVR